MADFLDILLSRWRFLSSSEKLLMRDVCGSSEALAGLNKAEIETIIGRRLRIEKDSIKKTVDDAQNAQKILAVDGIKCLFFEAKDYPAQLAEIFNPPYALYYRGELPNWDRPGIAVVGTRLASGSGIDAAFRLGFELGQRGLPVVSGLAMGIDSAAHAGCCKAGGHTIAVLGSGPDRIYPAVNRKLAVEILSAGGAIVSEYLPGEEPRRHHFPERNRLISGLSRGVVVVDAPGKSGALITADFALEQGRDLYVHSAGLRASGTHERLDRMIFDGAPVIDDAEQIFRDWGIILEKRLPEPVENDNITSGQAGIRMAELLSDELAGKNIKFNGNYFRRACYESSYSINS
ncbi:MAG TPA: DNA-protecting protein DprA [Spirochaeta sp.]|nr:DNA-protecting protein DprA [Spirochaeta sp.]